VTGNDGAITLIGVADVAPSRDHGDEQFDLTRAILESADITFGQLETPLSNRGKRQLFAGLGGGAWEGEAFDPLAQAKVLRRAGFDVMSFAGNHTLDRSEASMFDTVDAMHEVGVELVGVGHDIDEARRPVVLERKGTKVGFLAYCSVIPKGYEATATRSGIPPLRARTFYEQVDWQPGTPPKRHSYCYGEDLSAMVADIERLRPEVDVLVVSYHWGVHFEPGTIAMYQFEASHAAIDAGADLILGHHAHIMKGVEVYKGKAIFYSLNNYVLFARDEHERILTADSPPTDSQKTLMVKALIRNGELEQVRVVPIWFDYRVIPEAPPASDWRNDSVYDYMRWCCEFENLDTKFERDGDELVVLT
jgi:poly-gamma-glutamate capsule biosynthesis protein CapA/YwtB (metallophosphatase superfamily)